MTTLADTQHAFRLIHAPDGLGGAELMLDGGWIGVNEQFSVHIVRVGNDLRVEVYAYMCEDFPPLATMFATGEAVTAVRKQEA